MKQTNDAVSGEQIIQRTANDSIRVEVLYESETLWLNQIQVGELFGVEVRTANESSRNIYDSSELFEGATLRRSPYLSEGQYDKVRVCQNRRFERDKEAEMKGIESKRPRKRKEEP